MINRNRIAGGLLAFPALWLLLFFIAPLLIMAVYSFRPDMRGGLFSLSWMPTLAHYEKVVGGGIYMPLLGLSIVVALLVALVATTLAYPLAYFLVFRARQRASVLLTLLILPFWTSYLLRIISWKIILGSRGLINTLLIQVGLVEEPVPILLYSRLAVIITLVYLWLPFVALPIYAALQRIDRSLLEAASILGAPPWLRFLRITFPLSLPGVLAGFFMVFIPTVGEYITPLLVGGSRGTLYGNAVQQFFGEGLNWPLGSAMALVMLAAILALVAVLARLVDLKKFVD